MFPDVSYITRIGSESVSSLILEVFASQPNTEERGGRRFIRKFDLRVEGNVEGNDTSVIAFSPLIHCSGLEGELIESEDAEGQYQLCWCPKGEDLSSMNQTL